MADSDSSFKIVVGLGNPGAKYNGTRHNVGFELLNELSTRLAAPSPRAQFEGQAATIINGNQKLLLLWPLTYMNNSGRCVKAFANFYKIDVTKNLAIVCDDLSLPTGKLRIRPQGSAGGQKGLKDILQCCGTQEIARFRIGIDPTPPNWNTADYVLGKFRKDERELVDLAIKKTSDAILDWCSKDLAYCMNHYN